MKLTESALDESVQRLRELIGRDEAVDCPIEKEFLVKFIRARKYDVESAFLTLKRYYEMRKLYWEDFQILYPSALTHTISSGIFTVLKHRDPYGRKVLVFRTEHWNISKHSVNQVFLTALLLGEEMILSKETQENGTVMIHDLSHLGLCHARHFNLKQIKKFITVLQGAFPAKFKTIHVINQPYVHNILFQIARPFLSKKFLGRVVLHGNALTKLKDAIPPEILPKSLGGFLEENEAEDEQFIKRLLQKDQHYIDLLRYGYKS